MSGDELQNQKSENNNQEESRPSFARRKNVRHQMAFRYRKSVKTLDSILMQLQSEMLQLDEMRMKLEENSNNLRESTLTDLVQRREQRAALIDVIQKRIHVQDSSAQFSGTSAAG